MWSKSHVTFYAGAHHGSHCDQWADLIAMLNLPYWGIQKTRNKKTRNPNLQLRSLGHGLQKKNKNKKKLSKTKNQERKITKNLIIKLLIWNHLKTYLC